MMHIYFKELSCASPALSALMGRKQGQTDLHEDRAGG